MSETFRVRLIIEHLAIEHRTDNAWVETESATLGSYDSHYAAPMEPSAAAGALFREVIRRMKEQPVWGCEGGEA